MQYIKIKQAIMEQIDAGMLSPRQKLPAERKLAESFKTTRVTLREALSLLEAEGRIYREDRRGWFISPMPLCYDLEETVDFTTMAKAQGFIPETQLVSAQTLLANKQASRLLGLSPFSEVHNIERVRYLDARPVMYVTSYVCPELCSGLLDYDLSQSLTQLYRQQFGLNLETVRYRISIQTLQGEIAQSLRATPGAPAMVIERISHASSGAVLGCDVEYWRHDALTIESKSAQKIDRP